MSFSLAPAFTMAKRTLFPSVAKGLNALFSERKRRARVTFSARCRCWIRPARRETEERQITFKGLTKCISKAFFNRKKTGRAATGMAPGVSSLRRGRAFDNGVARYYDAYPRSISMTMELRRFLIDVASRGFVIVGTQIPAWNEGGLNLLKKQFGPLPKTRICTAADVVLLRAAASASERP